MFLNTYELLDLFQQAKNKNQFLKDHSYPYFLQLLKNTFDPNIKFYVTKFPKNYKTPDTLPGISYSTIQTEIRKTYLFQIGNPIADKLSEEKRNQILLEIIESFEPKEAQIFVNMMKKDLKIPKLTAKLIKETFPDLI